MVSKPSTQTGKDMINLTVNPTLNRYDLIFSCVMLRHSFALASWVSTLQGLPSLGAAGDTGKDPGLSSVSAGTGPVLKLFIQADDSAIDYVPEDPAFNVRPLLEVVRFNVDAQIVQGAVLQQYAMSVQGMTLKLANNSKLDYMPETEHLFVQVP